MAALTPGRPGEWPRWGVMQCARSGQSVCGDAFWVGETRSGLLAALASGLGSDESAAQVARQAIDVVVQFRDAVLLDILQHCHMALVSTRGALMGLLRIDPMQATVQYAGVGTVECRVLGAGKFAPFSAYGIIGHRLPTIRMFETAYRAGDAYVLYSDGITHEFETAALVSLAHAEPQVVAETIGRDYGTLDDDVTVLVARYGSEP